MRYEIEKDVPIPERTERRGRPRKYPLDKLEVGDSFKFPSEEWASLRSCIRFYKRKNTNTQFVIFRVKEEENMMRCWRIK
jgi:hypothetical protein